MYSPLLGQFATRDPLGYAAGDMNVYRYCGNRVTITTDPMGLFDRDKLAETIRLLDDDDYFKRVDARKALMDEKPVTMDFLEELASNFFDAKKTPEQKASLQGVLKAHLFVLSLRAYGVGEAEMDKSTQGLEGLNAHIAAGEVFKHTLPKIDAGIDSGFSPNVRKFSFGSPETRKFTTSVEEEVETGFGTVYGTVYSALYKASEAYPDEKVIVRVSLSFSGSLLGSFRGENEVTGEYRLFCGDTLGEPIGQGNIQGEVKMTLSPR